MKPAVYLLALLLLALPVFGEDFLIIDKTNIDSFVGFVPSPESIYVGSSVRYNISFHYNGTRSLENQEIQAQIINPAGDIIDDKLFTYNLTKDTNYSLSSSVENNLYKLIYADVSGVYKLKLISKSILFFEIRETGFRQAFDIPIFFEVKSLEEKRILDTNRAIINSVEALARESGKINEQLLDLTKKLYIVTIALLIVSIITLLTTQSGQKFVISIIKYFLIFIAVIVLAILVPALISMITHPS